MMFYPTSKFHGNRVNTFGFMERRGGGSPGEIGLEVLHTKNYAGEEVPVAIFNDALTCCTVVPSPSAGTMTDVFIDKIQTRSAIQTRRVSTFINI